MRVETFIQTLHQHKNLEKIEGMENYMRNKFSFLGIQSVQRRELAREFMNALRKEVRSKFSTESPSKSVIDWETVFKLWKQPEREFQLTAVDYLRSVEQYVVLDDLEPLREIIVTKSWWDTIDALSKVVGTLVLKEPKLVDTMIEWSLSDNLWIRRISILHQLSLKAQTNEALLREIILNTIESDEFFIQKAIGWILREYAKTNEQWVLHFTEEFKDELSPLSYREALKNIHLN